MWKNKHEVELESRPPLCIPRQRSAICGSGFYLTRWGYVGSARGFGCEAQFLWLRTKPGKTRKLLVWLLSSLCVSINPVPEKTRGSNMGFLLRLLHLLSSHRCGITGTSEAFSEVSWSITLMRSGHVWSWMWFWAKKHEWRGMKTDRVKYIRVKVWCRGQLWPDQSCQRNYPGVPFSLAAALRNEQPSACL